MTSVGVKLHHYYDKPRFFYAYVPLLCQGVTNETSQTNI